MLPRVVCVGLVVGVLIRILLFSHGVSNIFLNRVEISTPVSSFSGLVEGILQSKMNFDPYINHASNLVHHPPLILWLFSQLYTTSSPSSTNLISSAQEIKSLFFSNTTYYLFISLDLFTAILVYFVTKSQSLAHNSIPNQHDQTNDQKRKIAIFASLFYFLNPFSIFSCVGLSLSIFHSITILLTLLFACKGFNVFSGYCLACSSYLSPHTILLFPLIINLTYRNRTKSDSLMKIIIGNFIGLFIGTITLFYSSFSFTNSWNFIESVYVFIFKISDQMPVLSLHWYSGLLMFEEFEGCFEFLFQFQMIVFVPTFLISSLNKHSSLGVLEMLAVITIFKPYPCIGDISLYISLLIRHYHLIPYMQNLFLTMNIFLFCGILIPFFWNLWVDSCTGNSNYFFAVVTSVMGGQALLVCDLLQAQSRIDYKIKIEKNDEKNE